MREIRPRLKETEYNYYQLRQFYDKKLFKVLFFSDPHGWLADLSALRCINQILQHNKFDEVTANGDIVDMPYISRHGSKLYEDGILSGYSEINEIEYTKEQILQPLRASTDAKIRIRLGNHDERITKPLNIGQSQLARLAILYKHYQTTQLETMLGIGGTEGFIYDPSDVYTYFDMFDVVHGLSLSKNAPEMNLREYMSSGCSGHTHRLHPYYKTNRKKPYVWCELGHTRIGTQVEYFPTAKIPDWQQGFVSVSFYPDGDNVRFFLEPISIIEGRCLYNGVVYDGNYQQKLIA
jgi:predicted phosphodiesterase